jgi:zinc protease
MKHLLKIVSIVFLLTSLSVNNAISQKKEHLLPVDENVRIGKLKNGFTYYIRKNSKPENRIEMRLVVKAGSVLEDEDQRGLAHFVEHMCFNGTKHFEKNELIHYLQSLGIQFGPEINAYTSFDETVYMLTLPSDSVNIVNTGYLVMEDWAHGVSFNEDEVNNERGVIIEEWRINRGANQRMLDKNLPVILKGSRYAQRLPIGQKEIIENAPVEALKRFYNDWYRPDLMAFIIVGDIDPAEAEAKIKEHFGNLKMPKKPRKREYFNIPSHSETLVSIATDKEAPLSSVSVYYKSEAEDYKTKNDYRREIMYSLFTGMINMRLGEIRQQPDPPFINAAVYYGNFIAKDKNVFVSTSLPGDKGIETAFEAIMAENRRVQLHGFTEGELERFKKMLLNNYERAYKERDKTESNNYASEYIRNFLQSEPIPGIEFEYNFVKETLPGIKIEELNALIDKLLPTGDRVIIVNAPEKEEIKIPSEERLLSELSRLEKEELPPYEDKVTGTDLLSEKPEKGKILFSKKNEELGIVEYKLSNGAKVYLKPTDFKNDEIIMRAESWGGQSLYPDKDDMSAKNAASVINESGIGEYSKTDLQKLLAGKTASVTPNISLYSEGMSGYASSKDMETLFQLLHSYFTNPRKDRPSFESYVTKQKAYYKNILSSPNQYFFDKYNRIKTGNHIRANAIPPEEYWDKIDFDRVFEIYNERFADASDFKFYFVGSFSVDSIRPFIETYLASLPGNNSKETWKDIGMRTPRSMIDTSIFKGSDPKSLVIAYMECDKPWNEKDAYLLSVLGGVLKRKYIDVIREEKSGAYSVQASAGQIRVPYDYAYLQVLIPCSPDNTDSLTFAALNEIKKIQENGVKPEDLQTAKEIERRETEKSSKTNNYWINALSDIFFYGKSTDVYVDYNTIISQITTEDLQRIAIECFNTEKYLRVVLYPEIED